MGIPAYFSYIVRNHSHIIRKLDKEEQTIDNLYMDCNSIIYDVVRNLQSQSMDSFQMTNIIIKGVIEKIISYIEMIEPNNCVYVAFDGVAPVAKLEQQRNRRYLSSSFDTASAP